MSMYDRIKTALGGASNDPLKEATREIATRNAASGAVHDFVGKLPDVDPVLRKAGASVAAYRELASDAHVFAATQQRKAPLLAAAWEIAAGEADEERTTLARRAFEGIAMKEFVGQALDAVFYGSTIFEVVWKNDESAGGRAGRGRWTIAKAEEKPREWFGYDDRNRLLFFPEGRASDGIDVEARWPMKFVAARNHPTYENPYGDKAYSRCFWPVAFKRGGIKFWSVFAEKYGMPPAVGRLPRGSSKAAIDKMLESLGNVFRDSAIVIPDDGAVEFLRTNEGGGETYRLFVNAMNAEISKALLTQTLTTELSEGGSRAATAAHAAIGAGLARSDKAIVVEAANTILRALIDLNFGGGPYPRFQFAEEEAIGKERAARDASLHKQGVRFTKAYYRRRYGFAEDEIELATASGASSADESA